MRWVDVTCPSCGAKLRGQLVVPLGDGPDVFAPYPHRATDWKGWCKTGTWTLDPTAPTQEALDLGGAA